MGNALKRDCEMSGMSPLLYPAISQVVSFVTTHAIVYYAVTDPKQWDHSAVVWIFDSYGQNKLFFF